MFRYTKLALAAAALLITGLAAATQAAPVSYVGPAGQTAFAVAAGSTQGNDFQGEAAASPVDYQSSLTSLGITFTASAGSTLGFISGTTAPNSGLAAGNTALFLNGNGGVVSASTITITPLANTTAFGFGIAPSSDVTLLPGAATTGQYLVRAYASDGSFTDQVVSSNVFGSFSFVGFTAAPGTYLTSIVVSTTAGGTPIIDDLSFNGTNAEPVPEPATMLLFGTGVAGLASVARRRRRGAKTEAGEAGGDDSAA